MNDFKRQARLLIAAHGIAADIDPVAVGEQALRGAVVIQLVGNGLQVKAAASAGVKTKLAGRGGLNRLATAGTYSGGWVVSAYEF